MSDTSWDCGMDNFAAPEPWQREPTDFLEMVYGPDTWVADDSIQQDIGPEFLMYYEQQHWPSREPQRFL